MEGLVLQKAGTRQLLPSLHCGALNKEIHLTFNISGESREEGHLRESRLMIAC